MFSLKCLLILIIGKDYLLFCIKVIEFYMKNILKYIIEFLIFIIELMEHNNTVTKTINGIEVETPTGFEKISHIHQMSKKSCITIKTLSGKSLTGSKDHIIFKKDNSEIKLRELSIGDEIITNDGFDKITKIKRHKRKKKLYDVTVNTPDHTYYTNDILSHNSIIIGIYVVWYVLTNKDRNIILISQNDDKVEELMDKIDEIIKNLPFYIKPGIIKYNIHKKFFDNGCKIIAQTTTGSSGASYTAHVVYIDEFALIHPNLKRKFYRTVFPTISEAKDGRFIISSTPRGMELFYTLYHDALYGRNSYNPMRTDYFEVPGRDEEWKKKTIEQLGGSEEDFNQEYGCQFIAGRKLLFNVDVLRKFKNHKLEFKYEELPGLVNITDIAKDKTRKTETIITSELYKDRLLWNPIFNLDDLKTRRFVFSIDLGGGDEGDYSVTNVFGVYPMTKKEIDEMEIVGDFVDYFKLVQVAVLRGNDFSIPVFAYLNYYLITRVFSQNNIKIVLEMNFKGEYFLEKISTVEGKKNILDVDYIFASFKHTKNAKAERIGINNTATFKNKASNIITDLTENNRVIIYEDITVNESLGLIRPSGNGTVTSQTGHKDHAMTVINLGNFMNSHEFFEFIEELIESMSDKFKEIIGYNDYEDDYSDSNDQDGEYDDEYDF